MRCYADRERLGYQDVKFCNLFKIHAQPIDDAEGSDEDPVLRFTMSQTGLQTHELSTGLMRDFLQMLINPESDSNSDSLQFIFEAV